MTASGLGKSVDGPHGRRAVLHDLAFTRRLQDVSVIYGPNGCGKSLLLRLIAGRVAPDTGRVEAIARGAVRGERGAAIVFAGDAGQPPRGRLSLVDYLRLASHRRGHRVDGRALEHFMRRLEVWRVRSEWVDTLARGLLQRALLALCLSSECDLVVLDGPTEALDDEGALALMDAIDERAAENVGFLIATHDARLEMLRAADAFTLVGGSRLCPRTAGA